MKRILPLLVLLLIGCRTTSEKDAKSANLYLQLANNQLQKGYPSQALATLLNAEKIDPRSVEIQNHLGMTYFALKQNKLAIQHFRKALDLDPKFTEGHNNLARLLIETGKYKEARSHLNFVFEDFTFSQQSTALTNMAFLNIREKNYKASLPYLQKAIRLDKTNCLTYHLYGLAQYELKDFRSALQSFDAALPLCRAAQFDEAHYYAALAYYKSGDKNRGIGLMNETILLYPDGNYQEKAKAALESMKYNRF